MNALDSRVTPSDIVRHLNHNVIGQDEAKKTDSRSRRATYCLLTPTVSKTFAVQIVRDCWKFLS